MEMISKEEVALYKKSDSYQRLRRIRNEGMESLQGYYEKYKDKEAYFKEETERKIVRERYSKGGMEPPRGILTECQLEKLPIGNISRGRFVKKRTNPGFVYGYDEEGRLVACDRLEGTIEGRELIFWETPSIQVGLSYNLLGLGEIMEVKYNEAGKIERYAYGSVLDGKVDNVRVEQYTYEGNQVNATLLEGGVCHWLKHENKDDHDFLTDLVGDYTDNVTGIHVTLYMDEESRVTDYIWYDDQRPNKMLKGVPKFKLVL